MIWDIEKAKELENKSTNIDFISKNGSNLEIKVNINHLVKYQSESLLEILNKYSKVFLRSKYNIERAETEYRIFTNTIVLLKIYTSRRLS